MGIVQSIYLPVDPWIHVILFLTGILSLYCLRKKITDCSSFAFFVILFFSFLLFGCRCRLYFEPDSNRDLSLIATVERQLIRGEGWIASLPICQTKQSPLLGSNILQNERTSFEIRVKSIVNRGIKEKRTGRAVVYVSDDASHFQVGDLIEFKGSFSLTSPPQNRNDFNRRTHLLADGLAVQINIDQKDFLTLLQAKDRFPFTRFFESIRKKAQTVFQERLSSKNAALASALCFGLRSDLDEELRNSFLKTGTVHVLAISGLHLSIICAFCYSFFSLLRLSNRQSVILLAFIVVFYIFISGKQPPVMRAGIMTLTFCLAQLLRRTGYSLNSLLIAALVLLLINPCELFQFGTQISFIATGYFLWGIEIKLHRESLLFQFFFRKIQKLGYNIPEMEQNPPEKSPPPLQKIQNIPERNQNTQRLSASSLSDNKTQIDSSNSVATSSKEENRFSNSENEAKHDSNNEHFLANDLDEIGTLQLTGRALKLTGFLLLKNVTLVFLSSILIWLIVTPLVIRNMNLVTPVAIGINPLIILPMSFALISALILAFLGIIIPPLSAPLGYLTDKIFDLFTKIIAIAHDVPGGSFYCAATPDYWCLAFYIPLIGLTLLPKFRTYKKTFCCYYLLLALLLFLIPWMNSPFRTRPDRFEADILSVGHGSTIILTFSDGRTALFDCGTFSNPETVGNTLKKTLWNQGIRKIDLVILSHADSDHYNVFNYLADSFPVTQIIAPPGMFQKNNPFVQRLKQYIRDKKIPLTYVETGDNLARFGFPEFSILHPNPRDWSAVPGDKTNAFSLVLLLKHQKRTILFPADLDLDYSDFQHGPPEKIDVMLAPHHGGKVARYRDLLNWGNPETIIISGGTFQYNRHEENLLRAEGYQLLNTKESGEIRIQIQKSDNEIEPGKINIIPFHKKDLSAKKFTTI